MELSRPGKLFPLQTTASVDNSLEQRGGLRCRLMDISEDGAAILVGGRAKIGMVVKVQFVLTDEPLVMCGVVKGVTFNQKKNQSLLHIQAIGVVETTKNKILSFVYNLFGEQEIEASG